MAYNLFRLSMLLLVLSACNHHREPPKVRRAFYYWKSVFLVSPAEQEALADLQVKALYVKFFDVSWNPETNQPMPQAIISFPGGPAALKGLYVIPTIFITNECVEKLSPSNAPATAGKIMDLLRSITKTNGLKLDGEIQIDCDWTEQTRDNYFALLQSIRRLTAHNKQQLSATIRLYQCKYAGRTGIPPVDRGLLMCYNMGNLKDPSSANSILQASELKKYSGSLAAYPLPLDLALPLFSWKVLFRNNAYRGLIRDLPTSALRGNAAVKSAGAYYTILTDTSIAGYKLRAGDLLRDEQVSYDELTLACTILKGELKTQTFTLSLYHLDSLTLSKYSLHELETVFDRFH